MTIKAAVSVFDSWKPSTEYPDMVGDIRCCGLPVLMRASAIACETCHTVIEYSHGEWHIVRVKGKAPVPLAAAADGPTPDPTAPTPTAEPDKGQPEKGF